MASLHAFFFMYFFFLYFFFSAAFYSSFGISVMHILAHLMLSQACLRLFFFILLFFRSYLPIYRFSNSSASSNLLLSPSSEIFISVITHSSSKICFGFFFIICLFTNILYLTRPCDYAFLFFLPPPQSCYCICLSICLVKLFFKSLWSPQCETFARVPWRRKLWARAQPPWDHSGFDRVLFFLA